MLQLKEGVLVAGNKYTNAIMAAVQHVYEPHGWTVTITAGRDGKHGEHSYHYQDRALDVRFWEVKGIDLRNAIADEIRALLPSYYDVIVESDHYHIEADAKKEQR